MNRTARCKRLALNLLPSLGLPIILACATFFLPLHIALVTWCSYLLLQLLYHTALALCRRDRALSPTASYERGERLSPKCAILVHGFADSPLAWIRQADALATHRWRVIVPELDLSATSDVWIKTLHHAIIEAKRTARHVEVWAHSLGGAVALTALQTEHVDRLVLWAPFLTPYMGQFLSKTLYLLHRICIVSNESFTWFPVNRHGKGSPESFYRVRRVIPITTFASVLSLPKRALLAPVSVPMVILFSQRDKVVRNAPVRVAFPNAHFLFAVDPHSSHALTNAADWEANLKQVLECV